jgi:cell division protein FtsZ
MEMHFRPQPETPAPAPGDADPNDFQVRKLGERVSKLRQLSEKLKTHQPIETNLYEIENVPAYKRRNVELNEVTPSSESHRSKYNLTDNSENPLDTSGGNSYLFPKVD